MSRSQVRRIVPPGRRSAGGSQDVREHPLVDARGEIGRFADRQQERAGMPGDPPLAGLPAGEEGRQDVIVSRRPGPGGLADIPSEACVAETSEPAAGSSVRVRSGRSAKPARLSDAPRRARPDGRVPVSPGERSSAGFAC
jgi:hypothetical protein